MDMMPDIPAPRAALQLALKRYVGPKPNIDAVLGNNDDESKDLGPVIVMDVGDNIGGGSAADSTQLLKEALELGISSYLQSMFDPKAAAQCSAVGIGASVRLLLGGHTDNLHGSPLDVTLRVRGLSDGEYVNPKDMPTHGGQRLFSAGLCAKVEIEEYHSNYSNTGSCGQTVLITSLRDGNTSRMQMYQIGIRPEEFAIVVCKGVNSPIASYSAIARGPRQLVRIANTAGVTTADLTTFIINRRDMYPLRTCHTSEAVAEARAARL